MSFANIRNTRHWTKRARILGTTFMDLYVNDRLGLIIRSRPGRHEVLRGVVNRDGTARYATDVLAVEDTFIGAIELAEDRLSA